MHLELTRHALARQADGSSVALAPRDAALLAWLALEGATPRARLAALLWPESDAGAARNTLRQRLFHLKKHCGELVAGNDVLRLADAVVHDLADSRSVLGELEFPDAPDFDAWLRGQRAQRAGATRQSLELDVQALEREGELAAALPIAEALLRLDGLSEAAHRRVMRLHYLRGDRAAALLAFDHCERTLKDEVGTRPSDETMALLRTVEQAHPHTWIAGQALPASALRPPRLIGRDAELRELESAWSAQQLFVVTGQAGTGKSRLLDAFAEARQGILVARARPGDDKVPLATLDRLVQRLGERWPALGAAPAYALFVSRATGPGTDQPPAVQSMAPVVAELLRSARAHGLHELVLDDLQFADDASADVWQELPGARDLAELRFGFASRPEGAVATARIDALCARSDTVRLALQPLAAAAVQPFVESLALAGVDGQAVAAALVRRIGGNPLHLLETIRHALEKHGHLRADRLEAPARVTELLEQRLLALPAEGLLVVRIAAVAGSDFDPELAADVSRRDVLELADAWHALERQGLLDARGFMHDLIGEAAHRLLPRPIARVLHARVAAHLARRGSSPARLAHHFLGAGDDAAAVPHLTAAARLAWHLGRGRELREASERAASIELARGRPDAAFDLLFDAAEGTTELGPLTALHEVVERMAPLAQSSSQRARVAYLRIVVRYESGKREGFDADVAAALALAIAGNDRVIEAECRYGQGIEAAFAGRLRETARHFAAASALHRSVGRVQRARTIDLDAHLLLLWTGQARLALESENAYAAEGSGDSSTLALVGSRRAATLAHLGEFDAASAAAAHALDALLATDMSAGNLTGAVHMIAEVMRRCGRWNQALRVIDEAGERVPPQTDLNHRVAEALGAIYLDLGRADLAHRHIEAFAAAATSTRAHGRATALRWGYHAATGGRIEAAQALALALVSENLLLACELALAAGRAERPELTAAQCAELVVRCEPGGLREQLVPLQALHAWLAAAEGDLDAAEDSAAAAARAATAGDVGAATPVAALWLARALRALGRDDEAAAHARRGAAWLHSRAEQHVPADFRESFLRRHPLHRQLVDWPS